MKQAILVILLAATVVLTTGMDASSVVVISATDVTGANDIEYAIQIATGYGSRPGTVILDSGDGPFTYTDADKSINIFYSDVTLKSDNGAELSNCADGVFFDALTANGVTIEGITFRCFSDGVLASGGSHDRVTIRNNTFHVPGRAVEARFAQEWLITQNVMDAGVEAIQLINMTSSSATNNYLYGGENAVVLDSCDGIFMSENEVFGGVRGVLFTNGTANTRVIGNAISSSDSGVVLARSEANKVIDNVMTVTLQGVVLVDGNGGNKVIGNSILGPERSGIAFEGDNWNNKVHGNTVQCAQDFDCLTIEAAPETFENNKISGNTP